ncbi:MAG TPA: hypothetical protein DE036_03230 [Actinobacteria bacterium]|nr:hypothetical protein [Actinomycetota bacterium]
MELNEAQILDFLIRYFDIYGYYIVFLLLLLENFFVIGLVVPGETVLLLAAFVAAQGNLSITYVIIIAAVAAILGNITGYLIGRKGGRPFIKRYGGRLVSPEKIDAAEEYFAIHGSKTVFIGRFAAGVRVFVPLIAGASKMNFGKFLVYTIAAVVSWTVGIGLLGFFFGQNWKLLSKLVGNFSLIVLAAVIALLALYIVRRRRGRADKGPSGDSGAQGA